MAFSIKKIKAKYYIWLSTKPKRIAYHLPYVSYTRRCTAFAEKMNQTIKKNIRLLSEKYNHSIEYRITDLFITNNINDIKIFPRSKYGFDIEYNTDKDLEKISTNLQDIYDVLIELLRRTELYKLIPKNGKLISLSDWIEEENGHWISKSLKNLAIRFEKENLEYEDFGGNRYELEFYKGLLIINDDLLLNKSNVIEIKNAVQQGV